MTKKTLFYVAYFFSFTVFCLVLIFMSELIGFYILGSESFIESFLSVNRSLNTYRMFFYGVSIIAAGDFAFRLIVFLCSENKFGLNIDIAIKFIDEKTLQKIYLKKWIK